MDAARHGRSGGSRDVGELATVTGGRARRLGLNGGGLGGAGWGSKEGELRASDATAMAIRGILYAVGWTRTDD